MCGSRSEVEYVPYEQVYGRSFEDMRRRVPDLRKIHRVVGWRPAMTLDQLLEITIRDMCDQMKMPVPAGIESA
jgi:UDP-glucose 4-epimerase